MAFDYFSLLSNGVGSDDTPTSDAWAILGISYGFITDSLSEADIKSLLKIIGSGFKKLIG